MLLAAAKTIQSLFQFVSDELKAISAAKYYYYCS